MLFLNRILKLILLKSLSLLFLKINCTNIVFWKWHRDFSFYFAKTKNLCTSNLKKIKKRYQRQTKKSFELFNKGIEIWISLISFRKHWNMCWQCKNNCQIKMLRDIINLLNVTFFISFSVHGKNTSTPSCFFLASQVSK